MGAAVIIQRWWHVLPWKIKMVELRNWNHKARQIQRWYRHLLARGTIISVLFERIEELKQKEKFAYKVQPILRGGTSRLKLKRIAQEHVNTERRKHEQAALEDKLLMAERAAHEKQKREAEELAKKSRSFFDKCMGNVKHDVEGFNMHKHRKAQHNAAVAIQKRVRIMSAKTIADGKRDEQLALATVRIQRKIRHHAFKKARWKATFCLEMVWIRVKRRRKKKADAITKFQGKQKRGPGEERSNEP